MNSTSPPASWHKLFKTLQGEQPSTRYAIAFTARSGSSWLCNLLTSTGCLGRPEEWFNPQSARRVLAESGCGNLHQFYRYLKFNQSPGQVFGAEISWPQLETLLAEGYEEILNDITTWFFLRRRDYVAQGVSLYKARASGRFHSVQKDREDRAVEYDREQIELNISRVLSSETRLGRYLKERNIQPLELWYEDLVEMPEVAVANLFAQELGVATLADDQAGAVKSRHTKIGDDCNIAMAERFRAESPGFIEYWQDNRGMHTRKDYLAFMDSKRHGAD